MRPLHRVRKQVLKITQAEMAAIAGTVQGTVSRWETGELEPSRDQLELILEYARANGVPLSPDDFFAASEHVPESSEHGATA